MKRNSNNMLMKLNLQPGVEVENDSPEGAKKRWIKTYNLTSL